MEKKQQQQQQQAQQQHSVPSSTTPTAAVSAPVVPSQPPFKFSHPHPTHVWNRLPWLSSVELLDLSIAIIGDVSDDLEWLSKYLLFPHQLGYTCGRFAMIAWLVTVLLDLALTMRIIRHYRYQQRELEIQINETQQEFEFAKKRLENIRARGEEARLSRMRRNVLEEREMKLKKVKQNRMNNKYYSHMNITTLSQPSNDTNNIDPAPSSLVADSSSHRVTPRPPSTVNQPTNPSSNSATVSSSSSSSDTSVTSSSAPMSASSWSILSDTHAHASSVPSSQSDSSTSNTSPQTANDVNHTASISESIATAHDSNHPVETTPQHPNHQSQSTIPSAIYQTSVQSSSSDPSDVHLSPSHSTSPTSTSVHNTTLSHPPYPHQHSPLVIHQLSDRSSDHASHMSTSPVNQHCDTNQQTQQTQPHSSQQTEDEDDEEVDRDSLSAVDTAVEADDEEDDADIPTSQQLDSLSHNNNTDENNLLVSDSASDEDETTSAQYLQSLSTSHAATVSAFHHLRDLHTQLAAINLSLYLQKLNFLKFTFDLGAAIPMAFNVQTQWDSMVQSTGFISGLLGVYKLFITIKPAT